MDFVEYHKALFHKKENVTQELPGQESRIVLKRVFSDVITRVVIPNYVDDETPDLMKTFEKIIDPNPDTSDPSLDTFDEISDPSPDSDVHEVACIETRSKRCVRKVLKYPR